MSHGNAAEMMESAEKALGGIDQPVLAAGVFALADDYKKIAAGGFLTSLLVPDHSALGGAVAGVATIEGVRSVNADQKGTSVRMLIAVTNASIFVFELGRVKTTVGKLLFTFDRSVTNVEIKKFGLSRHLNLAEEGSEKTLKLTGSTAKFSSVAAGDRAVLAILASQD